jgi:dihydropyrimidinase
MNVDYNPFEGWQILGRPDTVILRGRIVVNKGQFVGDFCWGRFLRRHPVHVS